MKILRPGKPPERKLDGGEGHERGQGFGKVFEILGKTPASSEPGEVRSTTQTLPVAAVGRPSSWPPVVKSAQPAPRTSELAFLACALHICALSVADVYRNARVMVSRMSR